MENQKTHFNSTEELIKQKAVYLDFLQMELQNMEDLLVEVQRANPDINSLFILGMHAKSIHENVERIVDVEDRIARNEFVMPGTPMFRDPKTGESFPLAYLGKR